MRQHTAVIALFLLGGAFVLGLLALAWMLGPGASQAEDATIHNCPQPGKWAISVWDGDDGTNAEQAFATCGVVPVAAAYYIDPDTQVWSRYFMGRAEISNLSPLSGKQGLLTLGATGVAPATPTVAASPTPSATPTPVPTPTPDIEELTALDLYLEWGFGVLDDLGDLMARADVAMDDWWDALPGSNAEQDAVNRLYAVASEADSLYRDALLVLPPEGWEGYHVDFVILLDKSAELFTLIAEGMDEYDFDKLWLAVDVKEDVSDQIAILRARLDQAASMQASSFDAQEGSLHNCPRPEKWAIASWDGPDATEISEAVGTCGQAAVAAAYYIDPEMSVWLRWFDGRPEVSNLTTLDNMQGVLALGRLEVPAPPSPTPSPTPVATPTPATGGFTVSNTSDYRDIIGTLWVVGEVKNGNAFDAEFVRVEATFFDATNKVVAVEDSYSCLDVIPSGGDSPFDIALPDAPANIARYTLQAYDEPAWTPPPSGLDISGLSGHTSPGGSIYHVTGLITNNSGDTYEFVAVCTALYDSAGNVIHVDHTYIGPDTLAPGDSAAFDSWEIIDSTPVASYRVWMDGRRT